jgi:hypothetical protein
MDFAGAWKDQVAAVSAAALDRLLNHSAVISVNGLGG